MKTLERLITLAVCTRTKQISLIYVSTSIEYAFKRLCKVKITNYCYDD